MTLDDCLFVLIVAVFVFAQPAIWAYKIYKDRKTPDDSPNGMREG